ncbi:AraC family transcriptional regulator [Desulfomarina profundi]|uniref:AraC family transcriptional regulator n=1 Tax=Desulfomarina profundi TaxID=2772557 RepID=A0A8D5FJK4_9BACT|nr:GlxA family transcriptional regulator [Desulfomarina profundi]BCL61771.1 AraC family transcriptional regulator [Desulfomarina profundi]
MIRTAILAVPGCLSSSVDGLGEILAFANSFLKSAYFTTRVYTVNGRPVQSYTGKKIVPDHSITESGADIIILPPVLSKLEESLNNCEIVDWLQNHHKSGGQIASVCAGSFLLAETGLLNGRTATTHWNLADTFRTRYPEVHLQIQRLVVDGGDYICCGGVSAWMDLALHLVTRFTGKDISRQCAKMILMDPHREHQAPYGMGGFRKNHKDQAILKVQQLIERQHDQSIPIQKMATVAALGERTFLRRFINATGISPGKYLQQMRMETARELLETTDLSIENIAESIGYIDYSAFRKLFKKTMGCTPSSYRRRFGLIS